MIGMVYPIWCRYVHRPGQYDKVGYLVSLCGLLHHGLSKHDGSVCPLIDKKVRYGGKWEGQRNYYKIYLSGRLKKKS